MSARNDVSTVTTGHCAEQLACAYLEKQGLTLIEKNYTIQGGEIDLIMRHAEHLVFVEVKMRMNISHGDAIEVISPQKIQRIIRTAKHYLLAHDSTEREYGRFDVVGIHAKSSEIIWIKNAFEVIYR